MDDKQLVQQAAAGDTAAFETLVERYQQQVYHLTLRMVGNDADAQDLAQEAFVRAWRGLGSFQFTSQFSTWLYRLTSNICIDFLRAQKRRKVVSLTMLRDDEDSQWDLPDSDPLPEQQRHPGAGFLVVPRTPLGVAHLSGPVEAGAHADVVSCEERRQLPGERPEVGLDGQVRPPPEAGPEGRQDPGVELRARQQRRRVQGHADCSGFRRGRRRGVRPLVRSDGHDVNLRACVARAELVDGDAENACGRSRCRRHGRDFERKGNVRVELRQIAVLKRHPVAAGRPPQPNEFLLRESVGARDDAIVDEPTAVNAVSESAVSEPSAIYNLQGQRIGTPQHGVYVNNGRVVVMK